MTDAAACLRAARAHMAPALALAQKLAGGGAVEVRAAGAEVELSDGRRMLDFGSYAVTLLGHNHPAVTAAVQRQLGAMSASTRSLVNPVTVQLAAQLVALLQPSRLRRVWFGQSGADAVEAALKLARIASGRPRVLAVAGGYHGKTLGALAATWSPRLRAGSDAVLAPVTHLDPTDPLAARRALAAGDAGALIVEPIQGESGVRPLHPLVLRRWAEDVRAAGGFLIADEIQCGFFRAGGPALSLALGLDPDAVLLGKALGGGVMPLSAAVCSDALYAPLAAEPFLHTTTFGGHPLSCAAGLAALGAAAALEPDIATLGAHTEAALGALARAHPDLIAEVRGAGLLWGVDMRTPDAAGTLLLELPRLGLLVSPCLSRPTVLRLLPPAVSTPAQLDRAFAALADALVVARRAGGEPPGRELGDRRA